MKLRASFIGLVAGAALLGCDNHPAAPPPDPMYTGTVVQLWPETYAIVDARSSTRWAPRNLPEEFEIDGLRVRFSGRALPIPPHVRLWGAPIEITSIEALP
jgi:hypothetical protein